MSHFERSRIPYRQGNPRAPSPGTGSRYLGNRFAEYLVEPEHCESCKARRLAGYWRSLIRDDQLPTRHDIEPSRIRDLVAYVTIIELHGDNDTLRLRYRLVGTAIGAAMGQDVTGKWLDEVQADADKANRVLALFDQLRAERTPLFGQTVNSRERRGYHNYHWAIFPLRDEQNEISHALMIEDYENLLMTRPTASATSLSAHM